MAEAVPNANGAATAFEPASDAPTKQGHLSPLDNEKGDAFPDSSNASAQFKPGSDTAILHSEPDADEANEKAPPEDQPGQVRTVTGFKWFLTVSSILSSTFLYSLDQTVVADVEPKIVERFGEIQKLPWLPIAFLLAAVSTNLIWYVDGQTRLNFHIFPLMDVRLQGENIRSAQREMALYRVCLHLRSWLRALCCGTYDECRDRRSCTCWPGRCRSVRLLLTLT